MRMSRLLGPVPALLPYKSPPHPLLLPLVHHSRSSQKSTLKYEISATPCFAAFAACVPGTRAAGYYTLTTLPQDPQGVIIANLPRADQASYATLNRAAYETVKKRSKNLFQIRAQDILKGLGLPISIATIASVFNQKRGTSVYEQSTSISDIIKVIGPDQLQGNAKNLAGLLLTPGGAKSNIVADPRGLMLLFREKENEKRKDKDGESTSKSKEEASTSEDKELKTEDASDQSIDNLFKKNAGQFKSGLGIGKSWIDNGLLGWYAEGITSRKYPIPITLSHDDVVALMCHSIFSSPTPPSSKAHLTGDEIHGIVQGMARLLQQLETQPTLETLSKLKMGPLKTDPVAFDLAVGLPGCVAQRPSVYALLNSLSSLIEDETSMRDRNMSTPRNIIVHGFAFQVGMDVEDMFWLMCKKGEGAAPFAPFVGAVALMCRNTREDNGNSVCSKSRYYLDTPGNGVLGWGTQSWVLRKIFERRLYSNANWMLSVLKKYSLLPAHARAKSGIFKSAMRLLKSTQDGAELNASGKEKLENLLSGKKPNKSQISKGPGELESGKERKGYSIRKMVDKFLSNISTDKKP